MSKRVVYAPRQFNDETWVVVRYDDTKRLSEIFKASQVETQEGATGLDRNFTVGDSCMAPWKRSGLFPAVVAIINGDKTECLKKKQSLETSEKPKGKPKNKSGKDQPAKAPKDTQAKNTMTKKTNLKAEQKKARIEAAKAAAAIISANSMMHVSSGSSSVLTTTGSTSNTNASGSVASATATSNTNASGSVASATATSNSSQNALNSVPSATTSATIPVYSQAATGLNSSASSSSYSPLNPAANRPLIATSWSPFPLEHDASRSIYSYTPLSPYIPPEHAASRPLCATSSFPPEHAASRPLCATSSFPPEHAASRPLCATSSFPPEHVASRPLCATSSFPPEHASYQFHSANASSDSALAVQHGSGSGYFMNYLTAEECPECILLKASNANLQQQVQFLQADLSHLREKYQIAIKDLNNARQSGQQPAQEERTADYQPNRGFKIPKAQYIIQEGLTPEGVKPGYCQFGGQGSNVMVPVKWFGIMKAKTKMSGPSHSIKKYMDGFFNPWDLQGVTASSVHAMTGEKKELFDALQLFASHELDMPTSLFHRAIVTKAGSSRRTMQSVYPDQAVAKKAKGIQNDN